MLLKALVKQLTRYGQTTYSEDSYHLLVYHLPTSKKYYLQSSQKKRNVLNNL